MTVLSLCDSASKRQLKQILRVRSTSDALVWLKEQIKQLKYFRYLGQTWCGAALSFRNITAQCSQTLRRVSDITCCLLCSPTLLKTHTCQISSWGSHSCSRMSYQTQIEGRGKIHCFERYFRTQQLFTSSIHRWDVTYVCVTVWRRCLRWFVCKSEVFVQPVRELLLWCWGLIWFMKCLHSACQISFKWQRSHLYDWFMSTKTINLSCIILTETMLQLVLGLL